MLALLNTLVSIRVLTFSIFVFFIVVSLGIGFYIRFGGYVIQFATFGEIISAICLKFCAYGRF